MKKSAPTLVLALALMLATSVTAQSPCPSNSGLLTHYLGGNSLDGIMFDVVGINPITVNCFETNWSAAAGTLFNVEIWTRSGTHVGFADTRVGWVIVGAATDVSANGPGLPTYVPIPMDIAIGAGETRAFYIACTNGATNNRYTDGTMLGATLASDGNVRILEGTGSNYPFDFNLAPREFNGTLFYTITPSGINDAVPAAGFHVRAGPGSGELIVTIPKNSGGVLFVRDLAGRVILEQRISPRAAGMVELRFPVITPGVYMVSLQTHNAQFAQRIHVQ